jgi:hypothetical protein
MDSKRNVVIEMDLEERRARYAEAKAESHLMLDPEACRAAMAEQRTAVVQHREDGYSCDWAVGMPRSEPPPLPPRTLTDAEIARMVADAVAKQPRARALTEDELKSFKAFVWSVLVESRVMTPPITALMLDELRKQLRAEMREQLGLLRADMTVAKAHPGERATIIEHPSARRA